MIVNSSIYYSGNEEQYSLFFAQQVCNKIINGTQQTLPLGENIFNEIATIVGKITGYIAYDLTENGNYSNGIVSCSMVFMWEKREK